MLCAGCDKYSEIQIYWNMLWYKYLLAHCSDTCNNSMLCTKFFQLHRVLKLPQICSKQFIYLRAAVQCNCTVYSTTEFRDICPCFYWVYLQSAVTEYYQNVALLLHIISCNPFRRFHNILEISSCLPFKLYLLNQTNERSLDRLVYL